MRTSCKLWVCLKNLDAIVEDIVNAREVLRIVGKEIFALLNRQYAEYVPVELIELVAKQELRVVS